MKKWHYYNEIDPKAAAWIRELIKQKLIPDGEVDERSITEVKPDDVQDFIQAHWFAGICGWPLALQLAGVPATTRLWTGSCPCQPFSTAGKGLAQSDERHLWPVFFDLIRQCRPPIVFGEQVASAAVVGLRRTRAEVQQMRDQEAILGFLRREGASSTGILQSVQEFADSLTEERELQYGPNQQTGYGFGFSGSLQGKESRDTFQLGTVRHLSTHSSGGMRADGNTFRPDKTQSLELPIPGSDRSRSGVHKGQCQSSAIFSECDESQLGSELDFEGCGVDQDSAPREIKRLIAEVGGEAESYTPVWVDGVQDDLEGAGYAFGACVMGAASVGAPHIRQRLYWVADDRSGRREMAHLHNGGSGAPGSWRTPDFLGVRSPADTGAHTHRLADNQGSEHPRKRAFASGQQGGFANGGGLVLPDGDRCSAGGSAATPAGYGDTIEPAGSGADGLGNTTSSGQCGRGEDGTRESAEVSWTGHQTPWSDFALVHCRDGKTRRVPTEPAFFPLAHGVPARVVRLRGYGNAIIPQVAATFIQAFYETQEDQDFC